MTGRWFESNQLKISSLPTMSLPSNQTHVVVISPYSDVSLKQIALEHSVTKNKTTDQQQPPHSPFSTTAIQYNNLQEGYCRENPPECQC